jgi:O-acetylhomoserine (thiol)-lyase
MSTKISTQSLHTGHDVNKTQGSRSVPIYQTTSYVFDHTQHAANLFALAESGYIYTRLNNPTNDILEQRLAAIEGGIGAVTFASGTAAISNAILTLLKSGDHIVASNSLYGGTYNLLKVTLPRLGITTTFVDPSNVNHFFEAATDSTRLFFTESLGNPKLDIVDIEGIAKIASALKIPFFVDNTVATPALLNPLKFGANVVIHSLTKYIGGQGNSLGGVVIDGGTFDWKNEKFPEFNTPAEGYHGLIYSEALGNAAYLAKLRIEGLRDLGAALSPFNSFQIIQGLETLEVRIQKHSENALKVAQWLQKNEAVAWVNYPGLNDSSYFDLAKKYLPNGQSGLVTFGLKSGYEGAKIFVDNTKLFSLLANIGDTKSLIIHPASTTHQQLTSDEQAATGVTTDLIRLSVGIEDIDDIIADIEQALTFVPQLSLS